MGGFSDDAVDALMAGKEINLVLADGDDVDAVANGEIGIIELLDQKVAPCGRVGQPVSDAGCHRPQGPGALGEGSRGSPANSGR
jgi:hypothetical protein